MHSSPFFPFLCVVCKLKNTLSFTRDNFHYFTTFTIYHENGGFANLSFIIVISFPHNIQIQPLKWLNCVGLNFQGLQLLMLKTKIKLVVTDKVENKAQTAQVVILLFHTSMQK